MSNHIKFLSRKGNHGVPNWQMMSGSMIMLWGLPHVLAAEQDVPTPLPSSCICPPRAAQDQRRLLQELSNACCWFWNCFSFCALPRICHTSCQPGACSSHCCFPCPRARGERVCHGARPGLTAGSGQPSLGKGWAMSRWALDLLGLTCSFSSECWGSFLAPLQMLSSSWKDGACCSCWSWITGKKVTGAWLCLQRTWGSLGAAHLTPLSVLLPRCSAWCPALSSSLLLILLCDAEDCRSGRSCSHARAEESAETSEGMTVPLWE